MKKLPITLAVSMLMMAGAAQAGTANGNYNVTATVSAACEIVTGSIVLPDHGLLGASGTPTAARGAGTVTLNCTGAVPYQISHPASSIDMTGPSANVKVNLYTDSAYTLQMNKTGGSKISGTSTGGIETVSIYGEAYNGSASSFPKPGAYAAAPVLTISY